MSLNLVNGGYMKLLPDPPVDSVNGQTGDVVLTTADVSDSTDKRYVTESEKTKLSNTSGTNSGDQTSATTPISATLPAPLNSAENVQDALVSIAPLLDHPVDSVNGQTGDVVLSTADINDSTDKRYVTDSQISVIQNTTGTNTGDQDSANIPLSTPLSAPLNTATNVQDALEQIAPLLDPPVDSVNGQTGVVVLTTADIADSTDKRYVTETEKTNLSNLSGTNSGDQNSSTVLLSAALPAPLASETTVQGALSAIAPFLGGSSSESVIYEFTQSGLSPSIGKQIRPTSSGWVNAQGNTIENATNVWTIIAFSGDDIVACKVGRVNVPSHGLGSNNTLLYLSATSAGDVTSSKPVGTLVDHLGFYLPVIFIEDANYIHVLGKSYPCLTNLLGRRALNSAASSVAFQNVNFAKGAKIRVSGAMSSGGGMTLSITNGTLDTSKCASRRFRSTFFDASAPVHQSSPNTHPLGLSTGTVEYFSLNANLSKDSLETSDSNFFVGGDLVGSLNETIFKVKFGFSATPPSLINFEIVSSTSLAAGSTFELLQEIE